MKRSAILLAGILLSYSCFGAEPPFDLSGFWTLNAEASDDATARLDDIVKRRNSGKHKKDSAANDDAGPIGSDTYRRYWEHVAADKEWRAIAESAHGGSLRSLLFAQRLAIAATENGYKVWYDDGFVRDIRPNPYGRVFSASGDELVSDGIGRTLSYYKNGKLLLETRTKPAGTVVETAQLSADGGQLTVAIKVDRPDWERIVVLHQVFDRVVSGE